MHCAFLHNTHTQGSAQAVNVANFFFCCASDAIWEPEISSSFWWVRLPDLPISSTLCRTWRRIRPSGCCRWFLDPVRPCILAAMLVPTSAACMIAAVSFPIFPAATMPGHHNPGHTYARPSYYERNECRGSTRPQFSAPVRLSKLGLVGSAPCQNGMEG